MNENLENSLLAQPLELELKNAASVCEFGKTVIFAPHPDDESLGCGGAIALLRQFGCEVFVVTVSDGTLSHPNSKKFPSAKLRDLRETEMRNALNILGVESQNVAFWRFTDRSVPHENDAGFFSAVALCRDFLTKNRFQTIFVPWRRDPHPDHLATHKIVTTATKNLTLKPRIIEYPIWVWELATGKNAPRSDEMTAFRLDISGVVNIKQTAIRAHVSQVSDLIDDDPKAFRLTPEILRHFADDWEIYLESK